MPPPTSSQIIVKDFKASISIRFSLICKLTCHRRCRKPRQWNVELASAGQSHLPPHSRLLRRLSSPSLLDVISAVGHPICAGSRPSRLPRPAPNRADCPAAVHLHPGPLERSSWKAGHVRLGTPSLSLLSHWSPPLSSAEATPEADGLVGRDGADRQRSVTGRGLDATSTFPIVSSKGGPSPACLPSSDTHSHSSYLSHYITLQQQWSVLCSLRLSGTLRNRGRRA